MASNLFNKLPQEVRNRIHEYLLGDRLIHIFGRPVGKRNNLSCTHAVCLASASNIEAHARFISANLEDELYVSRGPDPHIGCQVAVKCLSTRLSLSFLRTCRQVYMEATFTLYTTNTFGFKNPRVLQNFLQGHCQQSHQGARAIRQIFLQMRFRMIDLPPWIPLARLVPPYQPKLDLLQAAGGL